MFSIGFQRQLFIEHMKAGTKLKKLLQKKTRCDCKYYSNLTCICSFILEYKLTLIGFETVNMHIHIAGDNITVLHYIDLSSV